MPSRLLALLAALVAFLPPAAAGRHQGEYLHQVSTELATPCVPFAKPYARGKLRVLFLAPRTFCAREIVELWQRFDIEFEAVTFAHSRELAATDPWENAVIGGTPEEKAAELRAKLAQSYDAIILGNVALDALPVEFQYKLLKQVADGAGLLISYNLGSRLDLLKRAIPQERAEVLAGVALSGLDLVQSQEFQREIGASEPGNVPEKLVGTYQFHKGRIVTLNWPGGGATVYGGSSLTPRETWSLHWDANYDHYLSLVAKALLWAAPQRAARVTFTVFPPDGAQLLRAELPRNDWRVEVRAPGGDLPGQLRVTIRSHDNRQVHEASIAGTATPDSTSFPLAVPRLPCGGYYLDVTFISDTGVEQWGSAFFRVTDPLHIASLTVNPECVERGQPINVALQLSTAAPPNARVRFQLSDTFDRLLQRREIALAEGQTDLSVAFDSTHVLSIAQVVTAELALGQEVADRAAAFAFVPRRDTDEFQMTLWGAGGRSGLGMIVNRQYRSVGFNAILAHPSPDGVDERIQAIANLAPVPYSYRIMIEQAEDGTARDAWVGSAVPDGTIANPALQEATKQIVLGRIRNVVQYGPPYYTLGDENYFVYYPRFSPSDLKAFREYLQQEYRDLDDLNHHWGTSFDDWEAVEPLPDDQAATGNRFSMIHDRRSYIESRYAFYHEWLRQAIRSVDPGARVGAEGSVPGDLERTIANLEVWSPYMDRRGDVLLYSLAKPGLIRGMWWGGYVLWRDTRHDALVLWDQLLRGAANCNFFYCSQGSEGVMGPGMNWANYFKAMLPGFQELQSGIGQTLAAAEPEDQHIYIHYSMANIHAAGLCAPFGSCEAGQEAALNLLDRLHLNYRFMTRKQIEAGGLMERGARLLIMPGTQSLSDAEAAQIRRFVEGGGFVLADVDVGTRDEHLGERPAGVLDDLFGITRAGPKQPTETALDAHVPVGGETVRLASSNVLLDASVTGEGLARAAGGQPVIFARPVGAGMAVLLNFELSRAVGAEPPDGRGCFAHALGALAQEAGVRPPFVLDTDAPLQARMLRSRDMRYLGVWHLYPTRSGATVHLAEPAVVYDVRRGQSLGRTDTVVIPDGNDWPRLYALLPTDDTALAMTAAGPGVLEQPLSVTLNLQGPATDGRVIRFRVYGPDSKERPCYRRYPRVQGHAVTVEVPFALNDPAGSWTLVATDVATGAEARATIEITPGGAQ